VDLTKKNASLVNFLLFLLFRMSLHPFIFSLSLSLSVREFFQLSTFNFQLSTFNTYHPPPPPPQLTLLSPQHYNIHLIRHNLQYYILSHSTLFIQATATTAAPASTNTTTATIKKQQTFRLPLLHHKQTNQ